MCKPPAPHHHQSHLRPCPQLPLQVPASDGIGTSPPRWAFGPMGTDLSFLAVHPHTTRSDLDLAERPFPPWGVGQLSPWGLRDQGRLSSRHHNSFHSVPGEETAPSREPETPPGERAQGRGCPSGECCPACLPAPARLLPHSRTPFPPPRSVTLPSSSGRRRSSCAPSRNGTPWPCCTSSRPSGRLPRSERGTGRRPLAASHHVRHAQRVPGCWSHASAGPSAPTRAPEQGPHPDGAQL